ncbi:MAG: protease inhibitor I42 family protein [Desulfobacteraceae bacterium]|nr:protease inhibitor I42 family protein [Desulfobacteraceae bacterium]
MQRSIFILMILIPFSILIFSSCEDSSNGLLSLLLTEEDSGITAEVNIETKIIIELPSNPSTGYRWEYANPDDNFIFQDGESIFIENDDCKYLVGCGGKEEFIFRASRTGNGIISLVYRRSFEDDPVDKFLIDINVR